MSQYKKGDKVRISCSAGNQQARGKQGVVNNAYTQEPGSSNSYIVEIDGCEYFLFENELIKRAPGLMLLA